MQGVGITSPLVHVVPRVNVDQASLAVCIEDASSTLQRFTVKSAIVNINAVDFQVFHHPIQSGQIIVVPTGIGSRYNGDVHIACIFSLFESVIPSRDKMRGKVLVQPLVRSVTMN